MNQLLTLIMLVISLFSNSFAFGQTTTKYPLKPLSVGDKIPNLEFNKLINYSGSSLGLSGLKGKYLLIDFWATWCGPCIAQFPKIEQYRKKWPQLQVISVTQESKDVALEMYNRLIKSKQLNLPVSVVEDSILNQLFPHVIIPHYIWIDKDGIVRSITSNEEVNEANLIKFLNGSTLDLPIKMDNIKDLDRSLPIFQSGQLPINENVLQEVRKKVSIIKSEKGSRISDTVQYRSILTGYVQGPGTETVWRPKYLTCINAPIKLLYKIAFGGLENWMYMNNNMMILEGFNHTDSVTFGMYNEQTKPEWYAVKRNNLYNYEIVFSDSVSKVQKTRAMRDDVNKYFGSFGLVGEREIRKIKLLALVRTSNNDKIKSSGGQAEENHNDLKIHITNRPLSAFVEKLQAWYTKSGALPLEDQTFYHNNVDLAIDGDLTDINLINAQLKKYDLQFVEKTDLRDMIIVKRSNNK